MPVAGHGLGAGRDGSGPELTFAEVQEVFSQWTAGAISSEEVVRRHGRATLHFLESQWAVQGGTQEESARVRQLAEASSVVVRARPARVYTDFHDLFAVWNSGGISSVDVVATPSGVAGVHEWSSSGGGG